MYRMELRVELNLLIQEIPVDRRNKIINKVVKIASDKLKKDNEIANKEICKAHMMFFNIYRIWS